MTSPLSETNSWRESRRSGSTKAYRCSRWDNRRRSKDGGFYSAHQLPGGKEYFVAGVSCECPYKEVFRSSSGTVPCTPQYGVWDYGRNIFLWSWWKSGLLKPAFTTASSGSFVSTRIGEWAVLLRFIVCVERWIIFGITTMNIVFSCYEVLSRQEAERRKNVTFFFIHSTKYHFVQLLFYIGSAFWTVHG